MKEESPTIAELLEMRMDAECDSADRLADKITRGDGTQLDKMKLRLMAIDQDTRMYRWADELGRDSADTPDEQAELPER